MIRNYLLITWRSMMKNKLFIFINVLGLAVGIGSCIVAYFNWEYDVKFDTHHANRDKVYRVSSIREFEGRTTLYGFAPLPMGPMIRQGIPDASKVVRLSGTGTNFKIADNLFPVSLAYTDAELFDVFTFEFLSGQPASLNDKSKVIISDELAIRLFGSADAAGKQVTQVIDNTLRELEVAAVFKKQPANSSFHHEAYINYENYFTAVKDTQEDDWRKRNMVFVLIPEPSRVGVVLKQLQPFRENNNKVREDFQIREFVLDPFEGMARRDAANDTWSQTKDANPRAAVVAPLVMAVLVLLIACFNMTNTAIAISSRRLKEIGIRKVMGSMRGQLIAQFIGETTFVCFLALLLGLLLGEVLLASWNALWVEMKLTSHYIDDPGFLIFMIGILAFTALVAGSYPAFYISGFEPVSILKGKLRFGGTNYFTRILLTLQYAFSLIGIVSAIAFYENSIYQRDFDLGIDQKGIINAYVTSQGEYETYRNALLQNKDIITVAGAKYSVGSSRYNDPVKHESKQLETDIIDVGDDYLNAVGFSLVAGRDFRKDSETDRKESVIISQRFADEFGWKDALGKEVIWMDTVKLYVIGVVKDVYTNGLWDEMEPLMVRYTSADQYTHVIVRAPANKLKDVNTFMEQEWKKVFPNRLYNGWFMNDTMVEATTVNNNIVKMFLFLGIVALALSATGLFTLVSLNIIKKMKEIGVRKVLGASIANITRIVNTEFIIILAIASMLGCAAGYFLVNALMDSIWDYYQSTTSVTFVFSVMVMFFISAMAIGYKVFSAASKNPVNTKRVE
jgi:putative ABC transport system permease protein